MVYVVDFDLLLGEGPRFVETDGLQTSTLHCFLRLGTDDPVTVEPFQTKGVDNVKEDRKRGWKTVGEKVEVSKNYHDRLDLNAVQVS